MPCSSTHNDYFLWILHETLASDQMEHWLPLTDQKVKVSASAELEAASWMWSSNCILDWRFWTRLAIQYKSNIRIYGTISLIVSAVSREAQSLLHRPLCLVMFSSRSTLNSLWASYWYPSPEVAIWNEINTPSHWGCGCGTYTFSLLLSPVELLASLSSDVRAGPSLKAAAWAQLERAHGSRARPKPSERAPIWGAYMQI